MNWCRWEGVVCPVKELELRKMGILVINLDRRTDRWARQERQFRRFGVAGVRFSAVRYDPAGPPPPEMQRGLHRYLTAHDRGLQRQPGVVGCYLSHVRAIETMPDDDGATLLCEDDLKILDARFFRRVGQAVDQLPEADMIFFDSVRGKIPAHHRRSRNMYFPSEEDKNLRTAHYGGAHAVAIRHRRRDFILAELSRHPITDFDGLLLTNQTAIRCYTVRTSFCLQSGGSGSDISAPTGA